MNWKPYIAAVFAVTVAGCGAKTPSFVTRDDADQLIEDAKTLVTETVEKGFGSPNDLVVWTELPVDFGTYTGTVIEVGTQPGVVQVELGPDESSHVVGQISEKTDLTGAAVIVPGSGFQGSLRVASYEVNDSGVHVLTIVGENGDAPAINFAKRTNEGDIQLSHFVLDINSAALKSLAYPKLSGLALKEKRPPIESFIEALSDAGVVAFGEGKFSVEGPDEESNDTKASIVVAGTLAQLKGLGIPRKSLDDTYEDEKEKIELKTLGAISTTYLDVKVVGTGLQHGRDLYLRHCMHCHGVSGDGNGPTAKYLNPLPRDYRNGLFKFTSTKGPIGATREDLYRTIKLGIPGTYMPSFMLLPDQEVKALAEYVRWLSARGMVEKTLIDQLAADYSTQGRSEEEIAESIASFAEFKAGDELADLIDTASTATMVKLRGTEDAGNVVNPETPRVPVSKESLKVGRELFMNKDNNCFGCHGEKGRGDGASNDAIAEGKTEPGLFDAWGSKLKPRNLTRGIYRGGRRPLDIYRRIRVGIKGTPMPGNTKMTDEQIWHLVNYVMHIPFEE